MQLGVRVRTELAFRKQSQTYQAFYAHLSVNVWVGVYVGVLRSVTNLSSHNAAIKCTLAYSYNTA